MKEKVFDIGIIGSGPAGLFAAYKVSESYKNKSCILFDLGRPPQKRRRFLEGFMGCFPFSDGKLYIDDYEKVAENSDGRKVKSIDKWIWSKLEEAGPIKVNKNKEVSQSVKNKAEKLNLKLTHHDYVQWKPESIHKLSRIISEKFDDSKNITLSFDNEVYTILKQENGIFLLNTSNGDFYCKKIIVCAGRSGWKWVSDLYKSFGIVEENNLSRFGITAELSVSQMKEFNKSHCSFEGNGLKIGPLNWNGTIIPEDHSDLVISTFRSNEDRWKSEKVSFQIIKEIETEEGMGVFETDRMCKLGYLLLNDRVGKEKIKLLAAKKSTLNQLPEYDWTADVVKNLEALFPNLILKGSFHAPSCLTKTSKINLSKDFQSKIPGLYVAGESANIFGIVASAISGVVAVDSIFKGK
jgi:uncharacterized FAD-dependent dehydrogenase